MSTVAPPETFGANTSHRARGAVRTSVPLTRIASVELRKSVDTRAGAWLLAGIGIAAGHPSAASHRRGDSACGRESPRAASRFPPVPTARSWTT